MAKGRIASSSRESTPPKRAVRQISQTERLKVMTQKVSVILTPCDLITDIDCSNFTSERKEAFEDQKSQPPEKGLNCHSTKIDDKVTHSPEASDQERSGAAISITEEHIHNKLTCSQRTSDQEHNGAAINVTEEHSLNKDLGTPKSGFRPVSFYGSRSQNVTPRTKIFSPNARKKLQKEENGDVMSDSSAGVKRKSKKQSNSMAAKKKRKTSSIVRQNKSSSSRNKLVPAVNESANGVCENKSFVIVDKDIKNKTKSVPCESAMDAVKEVEGSLGDGNCSPQLFNLNSDSEGSGIGSVSDKLSPSLLKPAVSEAESACSEASLCSGPGSVMDGLFLRKSGNEYFYANSMTIDSNAPKEQLTPSSENTCEERTMGLTNGKAISDPSPRVDQNENLMEKIAVCNDRTDDSQSSFSLSMPSPDTSESDFTQKLSDKETESSSSKSSPEHQASIMRYFKSVPGPKCKTKLIANGVSSSSALCSAENSPEAKNSRITPKKKKAGKKQEQMYLDLGQKDFGHVTCPTCGMVYTRAQPDDEAAHIRHHKSFVSGLKFTGWKNECVVKEYHDGRVIMVSPDDHPLHLKKVEEVRKVVDSELGFVSDVPYRRSGAKTFLFITTKKVVGCAVAVQIDQGYPVLPSPGESSTPEKQIAAWCCSTTPQSAQCGISRIWVHSQYRRKKVATRLLDCVRMNFIYGCIIPRELVAFSDPTPDGKRLAKSYSGTSQFLVFR